jgi:hypothetical protein
MKTLSCPSPIWDLKVVYADILLPRRVFSLDPKSKDDMYNMIACLITLANYFIEVRASESCKHIRTMTADDCSA